MSFKIGDTVSPPGAINVKTYGATGDGITDDTTAIQAAIDAATNKVVFFPPGTYKITSALVINNATVLRGYTKFDTELRFTAATHGVNVNTTFITLSHLKIRSTAGSATSRGLNLTSASGFSADHLDIEGWAYGIHLTTSNSLFIENTRIAANPVWGIYDSDGLSNALKLHLCKFENNGGLEGSGGAVRFRATDFNMSGCVVETSGNSGVVLADYSGSDRGVASIIGNYFEQNEGATIQIGDAADFDAAIIMGNHFLGSGIGTYGIRIAKGENIRVENNNFDSYTTANIRVETTTGQGALIGHNRHIDGTPLSFSSTAILQRIDTSGGELRYNLGNPSITLQNSDGANSSSISNSSGSLLLNGTTGASLRSNSITKLSTSASGVNIFDSATSYGRLTVSNLATPVNAAFAQGAGTLGDDTYYYRVSATNSVGETLASSETSLTISGGPAGVVVNWGTVTGATGYKVYGRATGAELLMATVISGSILTWLDDGSVTPSGALPTDNTTGGAFIDGGILLGMQKIRNGTAAPTTGTWAQGDIVYNTAPTAGGVYAWTCVSAGTPGTWAEIPVDANALVPQLNGQPLYRCTITAAAGVPKDNTNSPTDTYTLTAGQIVMLQPDIATWVEVIASASMTASGGKAILLEANEKYIMIVKTGSEKISVDCASGTTNTKLFTLEV